MGSAQPRIRETPKFQASRASLPLCAEGVRPPMPPPSFPPPDHAGPLDLREMLRGTSGHLQEPAIQRVPSFYSIDTAQGPLPFAASKALRASSHLVTQRRARVRARAKANLPNGTHGRAYQRPGCIAVRSGNQKAAVVFRSF